MTKYGGRGIGGFSNTFLRYKRSFLLIVLIFSVTIFLLPIRVLLASDHKSGQYLKSWSITNGSKFDIEYTHSVQLTPVIEIYSVGKEDKFLLEESYFYSYGAGLPSTTPYDFEITQEGFRIYNINETMDNIIYRTGAVRAQHKIKIGKKIYSFLDFSNPGTGVKFTVQRISLLQYLAKEAFQ